MRATTQAPATEGSFDEYANARRPTVVSLQRSDPREASCKYSTVGTPNRGTIDQHARPLLCCATLTKEECSGCTRINNKSRGSQALKQAPSEPPVQAGMTIRIGDRTLALHASVSRYQIGWHPIQRMTASLPIVSAAQARVPSEGSAKAVIVPPQPKH